MPELPEVETVVRDLRPQLTGRTVMHIELARDPAILGRLVRHPLPEQLRAALPGRRIADVARRGKYILMPLDQDGVRFIVHLGMTGHLRVWDTAQPPVRHTHFRATLDDGRELRFDDQRQFGRLLLGSEAELISVRAFPRLGPEPIHGDLSETQFEALIRTRRRPVKSALLDQSFLAGLGNIYADEACFRAGIRPTRWTHRLAVRERRALYAAIQEVLLNSIAARGTSIINYVDGFGLKGRNQERLFVYGRGGEPCLRCQGTLKLTRLAGRATVYCRECQR
jgi:formamidopyrimidine-DNA glycosylase